MVQSFFDMLAEGKGHGEREGWRGESNGSRPVEHVTDFQDVGPFCMNAVRHARTLQRDSEQVSNVVFKYRHRALNLASSPHSPSHMMIPRETPNPSATALPLTKPYLEGNQWRCFEPSCLLSLLRPCLCRCRVAAFAVDACEAGRADGA